MDKQAVGAKLAELRKSSGHSQTSLAQLAGTSRTTLNNVEKGEQSISLDLFLRISQALQMSPPSLLRMVLNDTVSLSKDAVDQKDKDIRFAIEKLILS